MTPTELVSARRKLGWTQLDMAEHIGVDLSTVQRWERQGQRPKRGVPAYARLAIERYLAWDAAKS